jgi:hypothetical protein
MRSYPRNSQEAAARIVALVLISDRHVSQSELEPLERLDASRELGLEPGALPCILQTVTRSRMHSNSLKCITIERNV